MIVRQNSLAPSSLILINIACQSLIRFISNILLAQILAPAAFALTAITSLIITGLHMVSDIGIVVMTLRNGEPSAEIIDRIWSLKFLRGFVLAGILILIAFPVSMFYDMPILVNLFVALSVSVIVQESQSLYPVVQIGRGNLTPSLFLEVGARAFGAVTAVVVALISPTVWSIIAGVIGQALFATILSHSLANRSPRFVIDWAFINDQWKFTRWIQMSTSITFLSSQIDRILFPILYGFTLFGIYGIGAAFALIPAQATQKWSSSVFYPLTVQLMRKGVSSRRLLQELRLTMMLYSVVAAIAIVVVSPSFFYLLYKPIYHEAGRFAQLLTAAFFFEMTESTLRQFLLVDATPRFEFIAVVARISVFLAFVALIWTGSGGAALYGLAYTGAQAASYLFMLAICSRRGYVTPKQDLLLAAPLGAAVVLAYFLPFAPGSQLGALLISVATGGVALAAIWGIFRRRGMPSLAREAPPASVV